MSTGDRLKAFTYVTVEKAWLYRAIARAFMAAKEQFKIHLRPDDLVGALDGAGLPEQVTGPGSTRRSRS